MDGEARIYNAPIDKTRNVTSAAREDPRQVTRIAKADSCLLARLGGKKKMGNLSTNFYLDLSSSFVFVPPAACSRERRLLFGMEVMNETTSGGEKKHNGIAVLAACAALVGSAMGWQLIGAGVVVHLVVLIFGVLLGALFRHVPDGHAAAATSRGDAVADDIAPIMSGSDGGPATASADEEHLVPSSYLSNGGASSGGSSSGSSAGATSTSPPLHWVGGEATPPPPTPAGLRTAEFYAPPQLGAGIPRRTQQVRRPLARSRACSRRTPLGGAGGGSAQATAREAGGRAVDAYDGDDSVEDEGEGTDDSRLRGSAGAADWLVGAGFGDTTR